MFHLLQIGARKALALTSLVCFAGCYAALASETEKQSTSDRKIVAQRTNLSETVSTENLKAASLKTCVQPSYDAWEKVRVGMSIAELKEILGEPIQKSRPSENAPFGAVGPDEMSFVNSMTYGRIEFDSPQCPDKFEFTVEVMDGKVLEKILPFQHELSATDKPTAPTLISPTTGSELGHYPRYMDHRWFPSSGAYPITYEVEIQWGSEDYVENADGSIGPESTIEYYEDDSTVLESNIPYALSMFVGANPGRWRVRAKNAYGVSDWSEWWEFSFSQ